MTSWVGIDVGTQSLKVVVWQPAAGGSRVLAEASSAYGVDYPRPRWAQQDPAAWEQALVRTVAIAMTAAGLDVDAIAGLGVTGQLDGTIAVSAAGEAVVPALRWEEQDVACHQPLSACRN
jgi:xylulokinase